MKQKIESDGRINVLISLDSFEKFWLVNGIYFWESRNRTDQKWTGLVCLKKYIYIYTVLLKYTNGVKHQRTLNNIKKSSFQLNPY